MKHLITVLGCLLISAFLRAQDSAWNEKDAVPGVTIQQKSNLGKRVLVVTAVNGVLYGGTMIALYATWYKNYPQRNFHFFNDNAEWLQVDKAGHTWSAYTEGRACMAMWQWAAEPPWKSVWLGGLSGLAYQTIIEVLDGFSTEWGFSWGDYLSNVIGSGMLMSQQLGWKEQRLQLKFSTHHQSYATGILSNRATDIYGKNLPEQILKDYNAQTYWLSANVHSFFKGSNFPKWLNISVGYGADGMFGANDNKWLADGTLYNRSDIKRYRQFYIAPDIDLTKINTKSKVLKTTFFILNSFKFPAPSIEFSNKKMTWNWIHF